MPEGKRLAAPPPHVAGAGNGTIFWNTTRGPPPGPT